MPLEDDDAIVTVDRWAELNEEAPALGFVEAPDE